MHLVNGKLLYCYAPPAVKQEEFHVFPELKVVPSNHVMPAREQRATRVVSTAKISCELDAEFFKANRGGVHMKGNPQLPHVRPPSSGGVDALAAGMHGAHMSNPWKKAKREKKEKLRKKFAHLDQH